MLCRYRICVKSQRIKLAYIKRQKVVNLVDREKNGLACFVQQGRNLPVLGGKPRFAVHEKQNDVGNVHCQLRLLFYMLIHKVFAFKLNASRINQRKPTVKPLGVGVNSVSCYAGHIGYYGNPFTDYFIEKGGFAYIGLSDNGNKRFGIH